MISKKGFTLIEVMIAVVIISVVILALVQMQGNNTHMFFALDKKSKINQYSSFFISNSQYGFEGKSVFMDALVADFKVEDDLRKELKKVKVEISYQEVERIDMSKFSDAQEEVQDELQKEKNINSDMVFEIGKTIIKIDIASSNITSSNALLRLRMQ
ncbi:prepilin-type N-terminal cleavage/methylation domain-containing protein [bacterium]|nr:prepilin-type N-terminal cleavage/methylation domain-containing protein [bacterium]MBU1994447.1 prepilin-type N-terminal cleavage/methylation domain-containing protein [bacterium]